MKFLNINRHAKSSWDHPGLSDTERPLNSRGRKDAPFMGKLLKKKGLKPEIFISSTAARAYSTAVLMAKELEYPVDCILMKKEIYGASADELLEIVKQIPENVDDAIIFGHNPDFTEFANRLSNSFIDNIPTCGIARIQFDAGSWAEVDYGKGKLVFFDYPKNYE